MDYVSIAFKGVGYVFLLWIMCSVYAFSKAQSKKSQAPVWLQYFYAAFAALIIAAFAYSMNDGTVEECYDSDPVYGGGDCYVVEEYEVTEEERTTKAGGVFVATFLLAAWGIRERNNKENFLNELERVMSNP